MTLCLYSCVIYPAGKSHIFLFVLYFLPSVACLAEPFSSKLAHKRQDIFFLKIKQQKTCVLILSTTLARSISHSEKNSARYHQKYSQVFMCEIRCSSQIAVKLVFFSTSFRKIIIYQVSLKICKV